MLTHQTAVMHVGKRELVSAAFASHSDGRRGSTG